MFSLSIRQIIDVVKEQRMPIEERDRESVNDYKHIKLISTVQLLFC